MKTKTDIYEFGMVTVSYLLKSKDLWTRELQKATALQIANSLLSNNALQMEDAGWNHGRRGWMIVCKVEPCLKPITIPRDRKEAE